jgi:hypothetical protein
MELLQVNNDRQNANASQNQKSHFLPTLYVENN